ncbi:MAG: hypothetical protein EOR52_03095 [Mesorhizobium sp.]|uniref:hypothetical protein n=1 Tax=Mesorhizobium sp. TaxID=1871066 RepID=UPI000FE54879|nr:hypothetical protein [Mesorhizobium sp.]RWK92118.1 MAG: hypothetical protein EOR52_03095 [Mesorhizobium sp.]TJW04618.1 MAG: hypothetical protein E5X42_30060 [Mesorhizobium sp.]
MQEEEVEKTIHITANIDAVAEPALRACRSAVEIVAAALPALDSADFNNLPSTGFYNLRFEPAEDNAEKRLTYKNWLLGKAFQELATGARSALEQAYIYCKAMSLKGMKASLPELQEMLAKNERRASRMNFPDLIGAIEGELDADLHFRSELLSLQKVRNCLEHRAGVVSTVDCNAGENELKLDLPHLKMTVVIDGQEVEAYPGLEVKKGGAIEIRRATRTRSFPVGARITFTADEFAEIAHALQFFVIDLQVKLTNTPS